MLGYTREKDSKYLRIYVFCENLFPLNISKGNQYRYGCY